MIRLAAPLTDDERSHVAQERLSSWYQQSSFTPTESVLFQSYRGEFATDSQLAIHAELRIRRPDLELMWGVRDLSVAVPEGGRALLIESREWYAALGSSRYLCRNIEFERYFRKRPYQRYLQTFHGYPFKSMGSITVARPGATRVGHRSGVCPPQRCLGCDRGTRVILCRSLSAEYRFSGECIGHRLPAQ